MSITKDELLVLADYWEERCDPRAEELRVTIFHMRKAFENERLTIYFPGGLMSLLPEESLHRAACVFATRALFHQRKGKGYWDDRLPLALKKKWAWLKGEATNGDLRSACSTANALSRPCDKNGNWVNCAAETVACACTWADPLHSARSAAASATRTAKQMEIQGVMREQGMEICWHSLMTQWWYDHPELKQRVQDAYTKEAYWQIDWVMKKLWGGAKYC